MSTVRVIKPGLLTTIQDLGRWGLQSRGVPVGGPMDVPSHRLANALVGNRRDAATLEVTITGPELEFDDDRIVAVTGGQFEIAIDSHPVAGGTALKVGCGSRLIVGRRVRGARAYIAVGGGINVPPVFGSRATNLVCALGGVEGRPLKVGDLLPVGDPSAPDLMTIKHRPFPPLPLDRHARVRVLPGPQHDRFSADALDLLQAGPYTLDQRSDRMGFHLRGHRLSHVRGADIISDATPMGAIQVPGSGLPILLMADRQTTGGYPKIATTITADLPVAGQLAPGDTISFVVCSHAEALAALIAQERALMGTERQESV
ncbi:MAG: KipI antagonist [Blastocatellia bacterium]|nr:MAG: KipI antagonist [Blastocatellia bacterium]